jgi:hypothetical protein
MQHHQLPGHPSAGAGGPDLAALAEYMKMQQQQQEGAAQVSLSPGRQQWLCSTNVAGSVLALSCDGCGHLTI